MYPWFVYMGGRGSMFSLAGDEWEGGIPAHCPALFSSFIAMKISHSVVSFLPHVGKFYSFFELLHVGNVSLY